MTARTTEERLPLTPSGPVSPASWRRPSTGLLAALGLVAVTAAWGSTFYMIKDTVTRVPVADFLGLRFLVAAVAVTLLAPRAVSRLSAQERRAGVVLGLLYGAGQLVQTLGLQTTSASVSGFLTGMYVVFTPLLAALLLRARISRTAWAATAVATVGLGVLALQGFSIGSGELLTLGGALLYAGHIVGLGRWSRSASSAMGLTVVQLWVVTALCLVSAAPGGVAVPQIGGDWTALLWTGLVAGAFALVVQTWAQAHLAATRAAIIMTLEPVFAGLFAVLLGGEVLGPRVLVGGALVLAAMYLVELAPGSDGRAELAEPEPAVPTARVPHDRTAGDPADDGTDEARVLAPA